MLESFYIVKPKATCPSQDKQASMHAPRFGTQSKKSSKQSFLRGIKASISNLKIEDKTSLA